jgi:integrase
MASLYKKPIVVADPKTGQRVKTKSKKWWGRYRNENGVERRVPLAADKMAAQAMLNELVRKVERKAVGLDDPYEEHRKRSLDEHLADFGSHLASKGSTSDYVSLTKQRIKLIVDSCKFQRIGEIFPARVQEILAQRRAEGRSIASSNHYLRAIKMFSRWLVRDRRTGEDRLAHLSMLNARTDPRHERRILEPYEFDKLVDAARRGRPFRELAGPDRAVLYLVAVNTGLRAKELASLDPGSFDLESSPPTVTVEAAYSKHRRRDVLPIRPDLAAAVSEHVVSRGLVREERLWPGTWINKASAKMLRKDLAAASIPYRDEAGRVFDFHALRHQFISNLAHAGAHPKEAQALARHSTITLTMDRYTHLGMVDMVSALDKLPAIRAGTEEIEAAVGLGTGTNGPVTSGFEVPTVVPRGAETGAIVPASLQLRIAPIRANVSPDAAANEKNRVGVTTQGNRTLRADSHQAAAVCTSAEKGKRKARATGLEPATTGSTVRYSNQLSYAPGMGGHLGSRCTWSIYIGRPIRLQGFSNPVALGG